MLARGKTTATPTPTEMVGCDGCCCYCDLYNLAEYAYRDKLAYPPPGLQFHNRPPTPTPYGSIVGGPGIPPCPAHVMEANPGVVVEEEEDDDELKGELKGLQDQSPLNARMIPPDVAMAFLLSLDLLRNLPPTANHQQQTQWKHPLESRDALYQALESYLLKHDCHRRSSSYGTPGCKLEEGGGEGLGSGGGVTKEGGETPTNPLSSSQPSGLHIPHYQIDGRTPNGEGGGGNNPEGRGRGNNKPEGDDDEEELGAFWELLDSELRPIQPVRTCPESLSIFSEHKEMARRYLVLQQEIFNLRKHKSNLEEKLSQAEKLEHLGNQRYQDKIRELENKRENLRHTHTKLRQQLEQIRLRQEEQQLQQNHQEDGSGNGIGHNHPLSPP